LLKGGADGSESIEKPFKTGVAIMKPFAALTAALVLTLAPALALAQEAIREVRVQFPRGASSTTLTGTLKGRESSTTSWAPPPASA